MAIFVRVKKAQLSRLQQKFAKKKSFQHMSNEHKSLVDFTKQNAETGNFIALEYYNISPNGLFRFVTIKL